MNGIVSNTSKWISTPNIKEIGKVCSIRILEHGASRSLKFFTVEFLEQVSAIWTTNFIFSQQQKVSEMFE